MVLRRDQLEAITAQGTTPSPRLSTPIQSSVGAFWVDTSSDTFTELNVFKEIRDHVFVGLEMEVFLNKYMRQNENLSERKQLIENIRARLEAEELWKQWHAEEKEKGQPNTGDTGTTEDKAFRIKRSMRSSSAIRSSTPPKSAKGWPASSSISAGRAVASSTPGTAQNSFENMMADLLNRVFGAHEHKSPFVLCTTKPQQAPRENEDNENGYKFDKSKGRFDVFFYPRDKITEEGTSYLTYEKVHVVGELKDSLNFEDVFKHLSRCAFDIFSEQPHRRFLHTFTLVGFSMRLWVYDRSGVCGSDQFDIRDRPDWLAEVLSFFATMSDDEAGLEPLIKDMKMQIELFDKEKESRGPYQEEATLELGDIFVYHASLVSRATVCHKAILNGEEVVAKQSWISNFDAMNEVKLLKRAAECGVKGMVLLKGYKHMTSTKELREGLNFTTKMHLRFNVTEVDSGTGYVLSSKELKKSEETQEALKNASSSEEADPVPAVFINRSLLCVVTSPVGEPLRNATLLELVTVVRDGIEAHKSLCFKSQILHRDISSANLVMQRISDVEVKGWLIDLDHAIIMDENWMTTAPGQRLHGTPRRIGTTMFMSINVLDGNYHTYKDDLESFFYVLLYSCLRASQKLYNTTPHREDAKSKHRSIQILLSGWETGPLEQIVISKIALQSSPGLERVLAYLHPDYSCTSLFREYSKVLWGSAPRDSQIGVSRFYNKIIRKLDKSITELKRAELERAQK